MWPQIAVIIWAQWRTVRNHLPRAGFASVLGNALSVLWYLLVFCVALSLAVLVPSLPAGTLEEWLAPVLLGLCVVWQVIPLFTLSTGWSLQLSKLQIYPVRTRALFGIEVLLRATAAPELILILLGGTVGLLRHAALPAATPLAVLLLLPINLLLSLAVREVVLHSFERNRFRELFSILLISLGVLPQVLLRTSAGHRSRPYLLALAHTPLTPWTSTARLALGRGQGFDLLAVLLWAVLAYVLAQWFFARSLQFEETPQSGSLAVRSRPQGQPPTRESSLSELPARLLGDPLAALLQKELASLLRMPRFRVAFGMACVFSMLIFLPLAMNTERAGSQFLNRNFLPMVTLYGLLILSDSLLLNVFGVDRAAIALYLAAPVPFRTVLQAKNLAAVVFLAAQSAIAMVGGALLRRSVQVLDVATALSAVAVVGLFFLSVGNLTSILLARPSDPRQTFRKAAGGKMQLWLLLCTVGMAVLLGAAYLARWAIGSIWAQFAVLALEFVLGLVFYRVALDSAVEHAARDRERLVDALSKGATVIGSGN